MMSAYRSHTCGELTANAGTEIRLSGWVHRVRDHGGVLFIDLRDHYGITQVIADSDSPAFAALEKLRAETVIASTARSKLRDAAAVNPKLPTGEIEVYATGMEVLAPRTTAAAGLPAIRTIPKRGTYRFPRPPTRSLHNNIMLRVPRWSASIRNAMWDQGFNEFQTPIITASSARRGARLSWCRRGCIRASSCPAAGPQQFKQLIMVAGFDRISRSRPVSATRIARRPAA